MKRIFLFLGLLPALSNNALIYCAPAISPVESLLKEHGLLERLLLIYKASFEQTKTLAPFHTDPLRKAIEIMEQYIENFHEKIEEEVFSIFEKKNVQVALIKQLRMQHLIAQQITKLIKELLDNETIVRNVKKLQEISQLLQMFIVMYGVHEAHENTELFPLLYDIMTQGEINKLAKKIDDLEKKLFGTNGFMKVLQKVIAIEKQLGIYDISQYTPSM